MSDGGQAWRSAQNQTLLMNTVACQVTIFVDDTVDCAGPVVCGPSLYHWARSIDLIGIPNVSEAVRSEAATLGPDDHPSWTRGRPSATCRPWCSRSVTCRIVSARRRPPSAFRSVVRTLLPKARVSVHHFPRVKLANHMVTTVRRRVSWDRHDRRGQFSDLTWANRLLLMRGYNTLSPWDRAKLKTVLATDDPTNEMGAAWSVKEQLRRLLATTTVQEAQRERATFNRYVALAATPETTRLKKTIEAWWPAIATFIRTQATNAKTEAANVTIKHIKRAGRGYCSHENYKCRSMLYNAARMAT